MARGLTIAASNDHPHAVEIAWLARGLKQANPEIVKRVLAAYEEARRWALANPEEVKKVFISATKLPEAVVERP